jgi:hypothetical protein
LHPQLSTPTLTAVSHYEEEVAMGSAFSTCTKPVSITSADVNGDGIIDLLSTSYITDNVSILFGNGAGAFVATMPSVTDGPRETKAGDIDGDGDIDFAATNYSGNNVTVALRTATPPTHR